MEPLIWQVLFQLFLILLIAILSAADAAMDEVNEAALRDAAEEGDAHAEKLVALLDQEERNREAIHSLNVLLLLFSGAFAAFAGVDRLSALGATHTFSEMQLQVLGAVVSVLVVGYVTIVLGIQLPRRIAEHTPVRTARATLPVVHAAAVIIMPIQWLLRVSATGIAWVLRVNESTQPENATEEEIRLMLDESEEEGLIESAEGEMIDNIFEFNNIQIYDVMTHRVDVQCIDVWESRERITEIIRATGYSRFPVFEGKGDHIIGLLYVKDFFLCADAPLRELLKEPIYVPDSMICDDLFRQMQHSNTHFAIVTDEYGAFLGIVTMEDLIEEIVGNIYDEYDKKNDYIQPQPDGIWRISGRTELKDVEKALDIELAERDEFTTLGGLILSETKEIPKDGDTFTVTVAGLRIQVLRVAGRRIEETLVSLLPEET